MDITFQAFSWESTANQLTLSSFVDYLSRLRQPFKYKECRLFNVLRQGSTVIGLVITVKSQKKFCTLVTEQNNFTLTAHELKSNERVADFNFFIFDLSKNIGLYQYYHHSCALTSFNILMQSLFYDVLSGKENSEVQATETSQRAGSFFDKLHKKYAGRLAWSIIERPGVFADRVARMKDISNFEFEFGETGTEGGTFTPLVPYVKRFKHSLAAIQTGSAVEKVSAFAGWIRESNFNKARIIGLDETGSDVIYKLYHDFDMYARYNYDDMVPSLQLDPNNVAQSMLENKIVAELRNVYAAASLSRATIR